MEFVQKIGSYFTLCLLKNSEYCIKLSDLLIRNTSEKCFTIYEKSQYEISDSTDLRIQIINFLREDIERRKLEGTRVVKTTRQTRKIANKLPSQIT